MSVSTFRREHIPAHASDRGASGSSLTGPDVFRQLTLTTTVPKEFVHRAAVAEVVLTDWNRAGEDRFTLAGQWPRGHSFFTTVGGCHDPLIAAETIRQSGILLAHAEYGVPLGHHFLVRDLHVAVHHEHILVGDAPASLDIEVSCSDVKRRSDSLVGLRIDVVIRRDGHVAATGGGSLRCVSPALYRRLRADRTDGGAQLPLTAPVAPQSVGRMSPTDVVLSPTHRPDRWQLRVDTRHPVLFDHPVDHVPGMVLLEAARQAAAGTLEIFPFVPARISSEFDRYVELDAPCFIEAQRVADSMLGQESVLVTGYQEDSSVFRCIVTASRDGG